MLRRWVIPAVLSFFFWSAPAHSEDMARQVRRAVETSTLDQPGTQPFHLKAVLAPSFKRDQESGRTGQVEIWWASPAQWRRDVQCPGFHQIQIVNGDHIWQNNGGDYFPEWLREVSTALIDPVPLSREALERQVKQAEVRHLMGITHLSWIEISSNGEVQKGVGAGISIMDNSGLLSTADGFGWNGWFRDYKGFHGRLVAQTVSSGEPEVTAKVATLEDLGPVMSGFFDEPMTGGAAQPLQTILLDETTFRRNLLPMPASTWPALKDGPLEGVFTTTVAVDREGKVREIGVLVSDNPGVNEAARDQILAMKFKPFVKDGIPVQVFSRITLSFKTVRPQGVETFESARTWFERGRQAGFPSAGTGKPYILQAEIQAKDAAGKLQTGHYQDTWISANQWIREATFGESRYVRSRNGTKLYQLGEGPDQGILRFVLMATEPIPALDTFVESDWRIKADVVNDSNAVRVLSGYESPEGKLDPQHARGFWFDRKGDLIQTFFNGFQTQRSEFESFDEVNLAHRIDVTRDGALAMRIQVTNISAAGRVPDKAFELKGHEWERAFTSEVR